METANRTAGAGPHASRRSLRALDALFVILADVREGLGPFVAIYLASSQGWDPGRVGLAIAAMGAAGILFQTPAGALIDQTRRKQAVMAVAFAVVGVGALLLVTQSRVAVVVATLMLIGAASAVFAPALAAISLGLVGHAGLARRMGRNQALDHLGNVVAAALAGLIGDTLGYGAIFRLVALMCLGGIVTTNLIRGSDINHSLARGCGGDEHAAGEDAGDRVAGLRSLLKDRRILIFGVSVVLFHFANAAMLPLVGQKLAEGKAQGAAGLMSACIIAAQMVMVPVALISGRLAERWGRKATFLIGFAVLPVRGLLYTMSDNPWHLVGVQLLDGVGAGIFGVVGVLVIADLTRGTGRFNLMQGALATATGVGAALSNLLTGAIARHAGFDAGFAVLAMVAAAALVYFWSQMPETANAPAAAPKLDRGLGRAADLGGARPVLASESAR